MEWSIVILVIGLAWVFRVILATLQINHYQRRINELIKNRRQGFFGTGISSGRLYRSIVMLTTDNEGTITDAELMKGYTLFARVAPFQGVVGRNINGLVMEKNSCEFDHNTRKALSDAANLIVKEMRKHNKDEKVI
jgi:glucitol operon activator protein